MIVAATLLSLLPACADEGEHAVEPILSFLDAETGEDIDSVTIGASGGEKMVRIASNVDWTAASDAGWVTLANSSGAPTLPEAAASLKISASRNGARGGRSATVTLSGAQAGKTLVVFQPGASDTADQGFQQATAALAQMGNGLNIGNTLDANGNWVTSGNPEDYETCWGNPQIAPRLVDTYKEAGVRAVRLPVTWRQHIDDDGNVDARWMARVRQVVDYVVDAGMYCIVNVHHDCGGGDDAWLRAYQDKGRFAVAEARFSKLWTNIANEFKDYGDKLLFEGYNEMLDGNLTWTSTNAEGYAALNRLAQTFVSTVRATGGNNACRNLIVCTYGADAHETSLAAFVLPTDNVGNHLIVEVHNYTPDEFVAPWAEAKAWDEAYAEQLDDSFALIDKYLVSKGIPTLIGEFGCNDNVPQGEQAKYAGHFAMRAAGLGVPCFHWFDLIDRDTCEWALPDVLGEIFKQR